MDKELSRVIIFLLRELVLDDVVNVFYLELFCVICNNFTWEIRFRI